MVRVRIEGLPLPSQVEVADGCCLSVEEGTLSAGRKRYDDTGRGGEEEWMSALAHRDGAAAGRGGLAMCLLSMYICACESACECREQIDRPEVVLWPNEVDFGEVTSSWDHMGVAGPADEGGVEIESDPSPASRSYPSSPSNDSDAVE